MDLTAEFDLDYVCYSLSEMTRTLASQSGFTEERPLRVFILPFSFPKILRLLT